MKYAIWGMVLLIAFAVGCGDDTAETPSDDSPALLGDGPIRTLCGEHCYADCERLVECGRYPGEAGYSACVAQCAGAAGRDCVSQTLDLLCPVEIYGPDRVVTQYELDTCVNDARTAACWCGTTDNCWDPSMPVPLSCTSVGLCDPRW
jgi:hypothetical protein